MKRSTERILTTHVGSLPRPADLRAMWAKKAATAEDEVALQTRLRSAIGEVVRMQKDVGIDMHLVKPVAPQTLCTVLRGFQSVPH